jgi:serine/threonine protein kinase
MTTSVEKPQAFGPFEVLEEIGRGATGTVYKVRHKPTGQIAALKTGPQMLLVEADADERFQRELSVIRPLRHPNIVRALVQGEHDGLPYLVMELVPGQNLHDYLQEHGALPVPEALGMFVQLVDGLGYLHANHILHRDIKPSNIFLAPGGGAKLGDFGLVKKLNDDRHLTGPRQAMGTIDYGAPEQFEDAQRADRRCDLYSLAATLYTALTAKFPFGKGGQLQIMQRKLFKQFVPLRLLLPALDPDIDRLVNRCLEPDPADRPADCDELAAVLRDCAARPPASAARPRLHELPKVKPAAGADRRASVRFAVDLTANFVPFHQNMRGRWEASILDVSVTGIRLQTPRDVAVSSVLQVTLGKRPTSELVLVRWVKPGKGDTLVAGCSFVRPLSNQDLEAICSAGARQRTAVRPGGPA